ncbi:MAG: xanthine phosphoribosyltransferase [Lachnospiraceae bacterium]|nr:xanthine phosphoribosyltransferase [Lachnospiraceae bacterium]
MNILKERILQEAVVLGEDVLKVSSFLNHQIDPDFMAELGKEIAQRFEGEKITKILTVEASGIPIALATGMAMHVPVIFAKKHSTSNVSGSAYRTIVYSFTHNTEYTVLVESDYLDAGDRVLIVDDFLANGRSIYGLLELLEEAGAQPVGIAVAIEKGFQSGGRELRAEGYRVESLVIIDRMDEDEIVFRDGNYDEDEDDE